MILKAKHSKVYPVCCEDEVSGSGSTTRLLSQLDGYLPGKELVILLFVCAVTLSCSGILNLPLRKLALYTEIFEVVKTYNFQ